MRVHACDRRVVEREERKGVLERNITTLSCAELRVNTLTLMWQDPGTTASIETFCHPLPHLFTNDGQT